MAERTVSRTFPVVLAWTPRAVLLLFPPAPDGPHLGLGLSHSWAGTLFCALDSRAGAASAVSKAGSSCPGVSPSSRV